MKDVAALLLTGIVFATGCSVTPEATNMLVGGANRGLDTYYDSEYNHTKITNAMTYGVNAEAPTSLRTVKKFDVDGNLISEETIREVAVETTTTTSGSGTGTMTIVASKPVVMDVTRSIPYERQPVINKGLIGGVVDGLLGYFGFRRDERRADSMDTANRNANATAQAAIAATAAQ